MSEFLLHQALFGYSRGHRLLASSTTIDPDTARLLRSASDTSFDGERSSYLSVLPLRQMRAQAFIRSWPADPSLRPGAVWSHVLLIDFPTLGKLPSVAQILKLFRRPSDDLDMSFAVDTAAYSKPISLSSAVPPDEAPIKESLASEVLDRIYGSTTPVSLPAGDGVYLDETLMSIYEQQWPRLRRSFSFRTRYRASDSSWKVDLEIVDRGAKRDSQGVHPPWSRTLLADLGQTNSPLRRFLARYGVESRRGRRDMAKLVQLHQMISEATDFASVADFVVSLSPSRDEMRLLKRDLFGPVQRNSLMPDESEATRLAEAIRHIEVMDLEDLRLAERLAHLSHAEDDAIAAFSRADLSSLPADRAEQFVSDVAANLDFSAAARFAVDDA